MSGNYLHGYRDEEQERLLGQADYLEDLVFEGVDFSKTKKVLEVGCGVGAQTRVLLRRFPDLTVVGIDAEAKQIERARTLGLGERAEFHVAKAEKLPLPDAACDGAFLCWVLEHIPDPAAALTELRRVLKPGALVFANEVFNPLFQIYPTAPATMRYWQAFNAFQSEMGGDPDIGIRLGILFEHAGFRVELVRMLTRLYDGRDIQERNGRLDYWYEILWSALPGLKAAGKVDDDLVADARRELVKLKENPETAFHFGFAKAIAARTP